jgi:uncharacterized protein
MTAREGDRPANRLAGETSPYLLQHAHNPVDWYPWGPEALAKAKAEQKPIFLSIGYAACHWCHVMERESFEDAATAADLARDFVAVKVDREERPDLDQVYMAAVQAMTGQGGWPMSVFLTPEGRPFYGGTYFPSEPRHGMPAFRQVLAGVVRAWKEDRASVEATGSRLVEALTEGLRVGAMGVPGGPDVAGSGLPGPGALEAAVATLEAAFDPRHGGWGRAPKFPAAMTLEFLLRRAAAGDGRALAMACTTLDRMADGGIRDQLGGGFHRYSVDAFWLVPHFEQMLYDNALLARVYVHAWGLTGDPRYREVAAAALDFMALDLTTADGGFAASRDADTGGLEGATYLWAATELEGVLAAAGLAADAPLVRTAYDVTEAGNFEGATILRRVRTDDELAATYGGSAAETAERLGAGRRALLAARDRRAQPARDDKVLAGWNGLAVAAFADAAVAFETAADGDAARADRYRAIAERCGDLLLARLGGEPGANGQLRVGRSWKDGRLTGQGVLEDHACLADGFLALYGATFDERWFTASRRLIAAIVERFADPAGGFFDTANDHEALIARPKDLQDNAVPSGNAVAVTVMLRLHALTGDGRLRSEAERALGLVRELAPRHPSFFGQWLTAIDLALAPEIEVAVVGDPADPETRRLVRPARRGYQPNLSVAVAADPAASAIELLGARFRINDRPTAFVCRAFACRQPVNEPEALAAQLVG